MLIGALCVYASQPLSNGRRIWRTCLISCCHFLSLTSLLLILSSLLLCQMSIFLSKVLPCESYSSLMIFHVCIQFTNPEPEPRLGLRLLLASRSPAFEQAIREFALVLLWHVEGDPGLSYCLPAMVGKIFGPVFPSVNHCFLIWTCSLKLRHLSAPKMGVFRSVLQMQLWD